MKDIIVPINFSRDSDNSLEEAIFLSKLFKSKIHLINIIEITDWWNNLILTKETKEKLTELSLENLKKTAALYPDIEFELSVLFGRIHEQIMKYSESVSCGLIVLCDKHKEDKENKILGSVVTHVITESKCPVITIKNKIDSKISNIVVPIDLSEDTDRQILSALAFNEYANANLHFISVLFGGRPTQNLRIRKKVRKLERTLKENKVNYTIQLIRKRKSYAYQDILEYSEKTDSDLIVLMTHKESYSFDNYIGAFAHRLINNSNIPVMTITSQAAKSESNSIINRFVDPLGIFKH
ncbi:MAG TPA: hypothetical protein DCG75_13270 [Bacteroidales bacterium]|jgi:nucleotide-binding universal stress UspA family protein|nr:hypothetical protein [Bacteroidales bacterium]